MAVKGNLWRFAFHVRFTFGVSRLAFRVSFRVSFGVSRFLSRFAFRIWVLLDAGCMNAASGCGSYRHVIAP